MFNICYTKRLYSITSKEDSFGVKPIVHHLRIFGSGCYKHTLDEIRNKFGDKSETLILMGYHLIGDYKL